MTNPRVFGSVARGEAEPGSDLGLVVDYQPREDTPMVYHRDWGEAKAELEALLGVSVGLFLANELKPSIAAEIEAKGQPV
jgi:predicted nucleotidyltransferase